MSQLRNKTPEELRKMFAADPYPSYIGKNILQDENCPNDLLLSHVHMETIHNNLHLSEEVYQNIIHKNKDNTRLLSHLCRVSHTPVWVLEEVYRLFPSNQDIQDAISRHQGDLSFFLLDNLSKSPNWSVRSNIARHKMASVEIIHRLQKDTEARVLISLRDRFVKEGFLDELPKTNWKDVSNVIYIQQNKG